MGPGSGRRGDGRELGVDFGEAGRALGVTDLPVMIGVGEVKPEARDLLGEGQGWRQQGCAERQDCKGTRNGHPNLPGHESGAQRRPAYFLIFLKSL
jgi:hypothetical protein